MTGSTHTAILVVVREHQEPPRVTGDGSRYYLPDASKYEVVMALETADFKLADKSLTTGSFLTILVVVREHQEPPRVTGGGSRYYLPGRQQARGRNGTGDRRFQAGR